MTCKTNCVLHYIVKHLSAWISLKLLTHLMVFDQKINALFVIQRCFNKKCKTCLYIYCK